MQTNGPSFIPKVALTVGRVIHQPFEVPMEMTKGALAEAGVAHAFIGDLNKAASTAVENLQPRGPAKLLSKLFGRVDASIVQSTDQAKKATETFWVPFSNGAHQVGTAVSNPFALAYAKGAGYTLPEKPEDLQKLLDVDLIHAGDAETTKFHGATFPTPAPADDGGGDSGKTGDGGDTGDAGKTGDGGDTGKTGDGGDTGDPGKTDDGGGDAGGDDTKSGETGVTDPAATPGTSPTPEGVQSVIPTDVPVETPAATPTETPVETPAENPAATETPAATPTETPAAVDPPAVETPAQPTS